MDKKIEIVCFKNGKPSVAFFLRPERPTTIGRSIENVVILNDERCSRYHATIEYKNEKWILCDLGSRNGTKVDGQKICGETEIKIGSKIEIGDETLLVERTPDFDLKFDSQDGLSDKNVLENLYLRQNELTAYIDRERTENRWLRSLLGQNCEMIGASKAIREVERNVGRAARVKATVLIRGESGVGKELVARAVHELSERRLGPMVCLNCAVFSESLLTSELFGYEKGAFTGATETKIGKFEAADGGTIFLDEIAEMNPGLQATFLRVLEGASFERVGGTKPISVDVRVVAATNRNLEEEIAAGRFRSDLYFRLRVLEIVVPPLRERTGDVDLLADHFLRKFSQETGRRYLGFSDDARKTLNSYRWPGNVRELKNIVERAVLMGNPPTIRRADLLTSALGSVDVSDKNEKEKPQANIQHREFEPISLKEMERNLILDTLNYFHWNKSKSAKALGIERTTLDRKIVAHSLERND